MRQPGLGLPVGVPVARRPITRNTNIGIGVRESPFHRRVDRSFQTAKRLVIGKPKCTSTTIFKKELFECEGEQRQGITAAAVVDILKKSLRQLRLEG